MDFEEYLSSETDRKRASIFCKSLYGFLIVKVAFIWPVLTDLVSYSRFEFALPGGNLLETPAYTPFALHAFSIGFLAVLFAALVIRINYFTGVLIWISSLVLSRLMAPIENGSDLVLNLFLFLAMFLSYSPEFRSPSWKAVQHATFNFFLLLCRIQFSCIYLQSGVNKLMSPAWRSGDAVYSVLNLEYFANPTSPVAFNGSMQFLAWAIIVFEVLFPVLVWFRRFQIPALIAALIFHATIIFYLNIPDFGLLMILACTLFLPGPIIAHKFWRKANAVRLTKAFQ